MIATYTNHFSSKMTCYYGQGAVWGVALVARLQSQSAGIRMLRLTLA